MKRLLVTGASGYIGRRVLAASRGRNCAVVAAVRRRGDWRPVAAETVRTFDLTRPEDADTVVAGVDAVIHLAAILGEDSRPPGVDEDRNVSGTRALLEAARRSGVRRFVFLSSQSAAADAPTQYGRAKWSIERLLQGEGEVAVRTGLVCGGPPRGVYGQLLRMVRRLPLLPAVRASAPLYPIHVDDLAEGLLALALGREAPARRVRLAAPRSIPFAAFVRMLARNRAGRRIRLVPLPAAPVVALSRLSGSIPLLPRISPERVLGLVALRRMDPGPQLPDVPGIALRDVAAALAAEGLRRRRLLEARALGRYVLSAPPPAGTLRRYVRAVDAERDALPLDLSPAVLRWPVLLRVAEPFGAAGPGRLRRRLVLAGRIVEMTTAAAPRFHNYRDRPWWISALAVAGLVAVEAALVPLRAVAGLLRSRR